MVNIMLKILPRHYIIRNFMCAANLLAVCRIELTTIDLRCGLHRLYVVVRSFS